MLASAIQSLIDPAAGANAHDVDLGRREEHGWAEIAAQYFLQQAARYLNECSLMLFVVDEANARLVKSFYSPGMSESAIGFCNAAFASKRFLDAIAGHFGTSDLLLTGNLKDILGEGGHDRVPQDFKPFHAIAIKRGLSKSTTLYVWACRDKAYGTFSEPDTREIREFAALVSALIRLRMQRENYMFRMLAHMLEISGVGFAVLDENMDVLLDNAAAEETMASGDHIYRSGQKLRIFDSVAETRFAEHARRKLNDAPLLLDTKDCILPIPSIKGDNALRVGLTVLRTAADEMLGPPVIGITLSAGARNQGITLEQLAKTGLTPAEADLTLALLKGRTVTQYAAAKGVAVATARAHLKRVMMRFGVHRQADLVMTLLAMLK